MSYNRNKKKRFSAWNPKIYTQITKGIYLHKKLNQLEFDIPELIKSMGYEPTEENKDTYVARS